MIICIPIYKKGVQFKKPVSRESKYISIDGCTIGQYQWRHLGGSRLGISRPLLTAGRCSAIYEPT